MGLRYHKKAFKDASVYSLWALQRLFPKLWSAVKGCKEGIPSLMPSFRVADAMGAVVSPKPRLTCSIRCPGCLPAVQSPSTSTDSSSVLGLGEDPDVATA